MDRMVRIFSLCFMLIALMGIACVSACDVDSCNVDDIQQVDLENVGAVEDISVCSDDDVGLENVSAADDTQQDLENVSYADDNNTTNWYINGRFSSVDNISVNNSDFFC